MFKLKRFVTHNGVNTLGNAEMEAICGRNNSHFCSTDDRNKKLVVDIALIWEDHTVVGVLIFLPVYAKAPVETTHNSQVSKKNEDVPILTHPLQFI